MHHGRGVAQPGSAPQWGCGGRRFKSSRPDQLTTKIGSLTRQGEAIFLLMRAGIGNSQEGSHRGAHRATTGRRPILSPRPINNKNRLPHPTGGGDFFVDAGGNWKLPRRFAPRSASRDDRPEAHPLAPTNLEKLAALTFSERPFFVLGGIDEPKWGSHRGAHRATTGRRPILSPRPITNRRRRAAARQSSSIYS